jgi:hypothetical protein
MLSRPRNLNYYKHPREIKLSQPSQRNLDVHPGDKVRMHHVSRPSYRHMPSLPTVPVSSASWYEQSLARFSTCSELGHVLHLVICKH